MNNSIGTDAVKLTLSKVITMMIAMLSAMLLSRFRTLEEYGTYSQILMVVNLMTSLLMLGLPNSINYFLARAETDEERQTFLSIYYTISSILSIIVGLVLVCATPFIAHYFNNELIKNFIYVLAIYPWAKIIMSGIGNILIVYKRTSMILIYRLANSISLILIILIVQNLGWGFNVYMVLFICVQTIFALVVYAIVRSISGKLKIAIDKHIIINILTFSIPIGLASVVGTLNIALDKLMIGKFFNTEQLAIYANASREIPVVIIASSLTAILLPKLTRMLKDDKKHEAIVLWGTAIEMSYMVICFLAVGFFVFAPDVMKLLYSEKYLSGVPVFRIYNIVLLLRCTYFGMILNAKGKTKFIFYSAIASLFMNIVLNYSLYRLLGFIGPALATLVAMLVMNLVQLFVTARFIQISFKNIFPWRSIYIITSINLILGLLFFIIKHKLNLNLYVGEIIESLVLGALWGFVYLGLVLRKAKQAWIALNVSI